MAQPPQSSPDSKMAKEAAAKVHGGGKAEPSSGPKTISLDNAAAHSSKNDSNTRTGTKATTKDGKSIVPSIKK